MRLKAAVPVLAGVMLLASARGKAAMEKYAFEATPGAVLELSARSFRPGEPILVTLWPTGDLVKVKVELAGHQITLEPRGDGKPVAGCLGLDLDVKPGPYAISLKFIRKGGAGQESLREIEVRTRAFPESKMTLAMEYVTPPASVMERIKRESDLLALIYSIYTPAWLGNGGFVLPSASPSWENFGERRILNNVVNSIHAGLDIRARFGDAIKASNSGRVALASDLYMSGKTVVIDHGLGIYSLYCHLSEFLVKRGQTVVKGQPVGKCGSTGRSTGPHLHWGFRVPGGRVDPEAMVELPFPESSGPQAPAAGNSAAGRK